MCVVRFIFFVSHTCSSCFLFSRRLCLPHTVNGLRWQPDGVDLGFCGTSLSLVALPRRPWDRLRTAVFLFPREGPNVLLVHALCRPSHAMPSVLQSGWRHTDSSASRVCYSSTVRIGGAVSSLSCEYLETHVCVVSEVRGRKPWERVG